MHEYVPRVPHWFRYGEVFLVPPSFWMHLRNDEHIGLRGYILGMN